LFQIIGIFAFHAHREERSRWASWNRILRILSLSRENTLPTDVASESKRVIEAFHLRELATLWLDHPTRLDTFVCVHPKNAPLPIGHQVINSCRELFVYLLKDPFSSATAIWRARRVLHDSFLSPLSPGGLGYTRSTIVLMDYSPPNY
jgi:hypothetical protein